MRTFWKKIASRYNRYNWLIKTILDDEVRRMVSKHATGILLDIGCGSKPYESYALQYVSKYIGVDHSDSPHYNSSIDVVAGAYDIPIDKSSIDCILCTEVLEHLEEPGRAIETACSLLRPGGFALYTVPFSWPIHEEPRDFYRYTKYGLQYLFEKNGFTVVEIRALDGIAVKLIQPLCYALWGFRRGGWINPLWWCIPPVVFFLQSAAYYGNKRRNDHNSPNTDHYSIVAMKAHNAG